MKKKSVYHIGLMVIMLLGAGRGFAGTFGGAEFGYNQYDNFNGATGSTAKLEENVSSTTLYLGNFSPRSKRSAFVLKGSVVLNKLAKTTQLNNNIFGLNVGHYYRFNKRNSISTRLGMRAKRFKDTNRDGEVYSLSVGLKQKTSKTLWFRQGLLIEHGEAETSSGVYDGVGVNASVNMKLTKGTVVNAGLSWIQRVYDVATADVRTGKSLILGLTQKLGKSVYIRVSAQAQENSANDGSSYRNNVLGLAAGLSF